MLTLVAALLQRPDQSVFAEFTPLPTLAQGAHLRTDRFQSLFTDQVLAEQQQVAEIFVRVQMLDQLLLAVSEVPFNAGKFQQMEVHHSLMPG
jgi:hypothetical protein